MMATNIPLPERKPMIAAITRWENGRILRALRSKSRVHDGFGKERNREKAEQPQGSRAHVLPCD